MPNMKLKSDENLQAGNILVTSDMFSTSIHCYYYSALQLSMHILCNYHGLDYTKQNNESKGRDSHHYTIESTASFLGKENIFYKVDYNKYIGILKMLRKRADYSDSLIVDNDIRRAQNAIRDLKNLLQINYEL